MHAWHVASHGLDTHPCVQVGPMAAVGLQLTAQPIVLIVHSRRVEESMPTKCGTEPPASLVCSGELPAESPVYATSTSAGEVESFRYHG